MVEAIGYAKTRALATDMLGAILALAYSEHSVNQFLDSGDELQLMMSDIISSGEFPLAQEFFRFSSSGPMPYSRKLDDALSRLQLGGLVGRKNPSYDLVEVSEKIGDFFEEVSTHVLSEEQLSEARLIAARFAEKRIPGRVRYA